MMMMMTLSLKNYDLCQRMYVNILQSIINGRSYSRSDQIIIDWWNNGWETMDVVICLPSFPSFPLYPRFLFILLFFFYLFLLFPFCFFFHSSSYFSGETEKTRTRNTNNLTTIWLRSTDRHTDRNSNPGTEKVTPRDKQTAGYTGRHLENHAGRQTNIHIEKQT